MCAYPFHQMEEQRRKGPFLLLVVTLILFGVGFYASQHFEIAGLDQVTITPKSEAPAGEVDPIDDLMFVSANQTGGRSTSGYAAPAAYAARPSGPEQKVRNLRIGSWALSGFGPSKLASEECRLNLTRVIRKFDVIALQQITAVERDLVPRLVDEINEGGRNFDFVLGQPSGPSDRPEQLAILFNVNRVQIDRSQTYTVADPQGQMTYDPMVAWFRAAQPSVESAWTFSVVNVRINLARAPVEVGLLPGIFASVRSDGRGEDDVVMAGLFQADDSYLIPRVMGTDVVAAVDSTTTDIFNRHQTCNILVDRNRTNEFVGRGGPVDFLRLFNLNLSQAEAVSSHLPVFGEFTATEGGGV
ncbi:deoxyribonuclease I [Stieleria mannarensis]|uniref:deoxyribonuclease I n=1 Tax=Stieleria mannarensis TaxID=2755585 RepID=UPI00256FB4F6|nr:deoxyribonuclease I [Rhodopirellula sp. JC639]